MLVRLENPVLLTRAIEIISELVSEVRIKINEFGMSINAIDPANVAMVGFKIPRSSFSEFESGEETLGVNLDDLKRILKRGGVKSSVILEKENNTLKIQILDRIKRNFSLNLIEIESEEKEMPSLEYVSTIEINSLDLIDSVEDCAVVADAGSFVLDGDRFIIEAKSMNSARAEFSADQAKIEGENCRAKYSLEYLQKFMKAAKLCEKTNLKFANDHPLRINFKTEHLELSFILAPRVETED